MMMSQTQRQRAQTNPQKLLHPPCTSASTASCMTPTSHSNLVYSRARCGMLVCSTMVCCQKQRMHAFKQQINPVQTGRGLTHRSETDTHSQPRWPRHHAALHFPPHPYTGNDVRTNHSSTIPHLSPCLCSSVLMIQASTINTTMPQVWSIDG